MIFDFGFWISDWRRRRNGFTLIEVLIVVAIVAVLMATALPIYIAAKRNSARTTCRATMQTIAQAENAYQLQNGQYTTDIAKLQDLAGVPQCPDGGVYTVIVSGGAATAGNGSIVPEGQIVVICNVHGKFSPGIDAK